MGNAGSSCCCCSKRERSVEDLLDGSLEDKLLGKREEEVEVTTAEDEAWRQRRQQVQDEAELSLKSLDADNEDRVAEEVQEADMDHAALIWDLIDRNTVKLVHKEVEDAVEDEEDEEAFGSAKEDEDEEDHALEGEDFSADRLGRLSSRSTEDSYASLKDYDRGNSIKVFRDTQLEGGITDTFLTSSPSSLRDTSFMDDDDVQQEQKQKQEDDQAKEKHDSERRSSSASSASSHQRRRSSKRNRGESPNINEQMNKSFIAFENDQAEQLKQALV